MRINPEEISNVIKLEIEKYKQEVDIKNVGNVLQMGDGIAKIYGLRNTMLGELLKFPNDIYGMALNLEEQSVGAIVFGDYKGIKEGDIVESTGRALEIPIGDGIVGRILDPMGNVLDGKGDFEIKGFYPIERPAPTIFDRKKVSIPLQTGIKAIDGMIPVGRGQRELIIGDRHTGKSAIAIDAIMNQKGKGVKCIYVAIGQKMADIAKTVEKLKEAGSLEYTTVVIATASDPAALQYLAPYSGCAMAEYFMDKGEHVLIVYDDLSKHAVAYREISLLLRRPPGREAYPGDVFFIHSRLLERAAMLSDVKKGGSITALPIVETQTGDISAYIPTNIISITDGQIYLESNLFNSDVRPAINAGQSVSRVGGEAQIKAMRQVASKIKIELAQYRELLVFSQFNAELDDATKAQLDRGARLMEILKQDQFSPLNTEEEVLVFYTAVNGFLDDVPVNKVRIFEKEFLDYINVSKKELLAELRTKKEIDNVLKTEIDNAILEFKSKIQ